MAVTFKFGKTPEGALVVELIEANLAYEVMEELVDFLEADYGAQVSEKFDAPFARRWFLSIGGQKIRVDYDDMVGIEITAESPEGEAVLTKIGEDLKSRLV